MRRVLLTLLGTIMSIVPSVLAHPASVAAQDHSGWDVTLPRGKTREIDFTTSEGTFMSVDLSPDGAWIVFDLLGHVYRMPATGGTAEPLTQNSGIAVNYHPRISPDGGAIAFVSDRRGQNNLWIMNADGSQPRAVALDLNSRVVSPAWTPDGQSIVVRREGVGGGGGGGGGGNVNGLWIFPRDGGEGRRLVADGNAYWPSVSPDGRYVYYHVTVGGTDLDALRGDYNLRRVEIATGELLDITTGSGDGAASRRRASGGAFAPEISPDGRWLAFARHIPDGLVTFKGQRFGPRTALWLLDLQTGAEKLALDPISLAVESNDKTLRVLPGYAWSRDSRSIVVASGGGVARVDVASGAVSPVPFQARVHRTISEQAYQAFRIGDGPFDAKFLRWHTASPDGRRLAFQAVGRVWIRDLPSGKASRLTAESFAQPQEFGPAWSPDGQWIAFTTWDDTLGGHLWKAPARAGGKAIRLTTEPGEYVHPAWSPDGSELVVAKGSGATLRGRSIAHNPWYDLVRVPAGGGAETFVTRVAQPSGGTPANVAQQAIVMPSWGFGGRIYFPDQATGGAALSSVLPTGADRRVELLLPGAEEAVPSPDGQWVAFQNNDDVYVTRAAMGVGAAPVRVDMARAERMASTGGLFVRWRGASTVEFGSGNWYYRFDVDRRTLDSVNVTLSVPRPAPTGTIAFTNARIVALAGPRNDQVIERGTLVVRGRRITCVGSCDTAGADRVVDAAGKTIIPGIVDMHSHSHREHRGYRPLRDYEVGIYMAYGVTTALDNSMWAQNVFPTAELIEAGRMIGPRTFSTGETLPGGPLEERDEADRRIRRQQSWGAVSLKDYLTPRRDQRQWITDVARERGLMVTAEGDDLEYDLGMIMDGHTGFEHPISVIPLYSDVSTFLGQANAHYSTAFMYNSSTNWNIEYWYAESDVWKDAKQRRWMPWRQDTFLRRRVLRPDTDYSFPLIAVGFADVIAAGGYGAIGGHGEHHGISAHWDIWMAATTLGPLGALRSATVHGAHFLGASADLGTLEPGKLADLIVLNSNPLENIRNTLDMSLVMKEGILYETDTLDEIWPVQRPFGPYYWMDEDAQRTDERPVDQGVPRGR